jgi:F-type H+-transporting ATPase subunit epsilon
MNLKILVPSRIFADEHGVAKVVVETTAGSMGLLPHRRDCAAAVAPGILSYEGAGGATVYLALDAGVMVKTGDAVVISVRRAVGGAGLADLEAAVKRDFLRVGAQERAMQNAMVKLEGGLIRHLAEFQHAK